MEIILTIIIAYIVIRILGNVTQKAVNSVSDTKIEGRIIPTLTKQKIHKVEVVGNDIQGNYRRRKATSGNRNNTRQARRVKSGTEQTTSKRA